MPLDTERFKSASLGGTGRIKGTTNNEDPRWPTSCLRLFDIVRLVRFFQYAFDSLTLHQIIRSAAQLWSASLECNTWKKDSKNVTMWLVVSCSAAWQLWHHGSSWPVGEVWSYSPSCRRWCRGCVALEIEGDLTLVGRGSSYHISCIMFLIQQDLDGFGLTCP